MEPFSRDERVDALPDTQPQRQPEERVCSQAVGDGLRGIALQDAEVLPKHFRERPVGDALPVREAAPRALKRLRFLLGEPAPELTHQACLPDSSVADDRHQPRSALGHRGAIRLPQTLELALPAHEGRS